MQHIIKIVSLVTLGAFSTTAIAVNQALPKTKPLLQPNHKIEKRVIESANVAVSKPLSAIAKPLPNLTPQRKRKLSTGSFAKNLDVKTVPNRFPFKESLQNAEKKVDPAIQTQLDTKRYSIATPTTGVSFDGVGNVLGVAPPDTNGDVGPNHYVQTVNVAMAVFDKEGNTLVAPFAINQLWQGFGGICESNNDGDPIVLYDSMADRWMISQFALNGTDNHECIAVSTSSDPTGSYYLYDFPYGSLMNDYPHFGVWSDGYYMGVNQFDAANGYAWAGGGVAVYEREKMLIGSPAKQVIMSMQGNNPEVFTPMPLDIDGQLAPNANQNQIFMWADGNGESRLHFWEFDVDWNTPENSTFTESATIDVATWNAPSNAMQPNGVELDGMAIRSMFRAAYRNLGDRSAITFTHNVAAPDGSTPALRWYEIDLNEANGDISIRQQGTFAPDEQARWMGSGAMDTQGNIAFGYSLSSADTYPSVYAATRLVDDPLNTLTDEILLKAGEGSQTNINRNRWGDYSSMSIDPADECTFWYTTEYYKAENDNTLGWSTNISSFKIPTCIAGPSGTISGKIVDNTTGEPVAKAVVSAGNMTAYTNEHGEYSLLALVGDYDLTVTRYGWTSPQTTSYSVEEDKVITVDFSLEPAEFVDVKGTITDGGTGEWPLYAKLNVEVPGDTYVLYTHPETGEYTVPLVKGINVKIIAEAINLPGYIPVEKDIIPSEETALELSLPVDENCTAIGYELSGGLSEKFDGEFAPQGWSVVDDYGQGVVWQSSKNSTWGNITKTEGDTAFVDTDAAGSGIEADTSLITPVISVADLNTTQLTFVGNHVTYSGNDSTTVDIKVDGGEWETLEKLFQGFGNLEDGLSEYTIDLADNLVGATNFQLRWHHFDANWEYFVAIDDVVVGSPSCEAIPGKHVYVYAEDGNYNTPLMHANLKVNDKLYMSQTMPEDSHLSSGLLHAFVPSEVDNVEISAYGYATKDVSVGDLSLASPIMLDAGLLELEDSVSFSVTKGRQIEEDLLVKNIGKAGVEVSILTLPYVDMQSMYGQFDASARHFGPKHLQKLDTKDIRHFPEIHAYEMLAPVYNSHFALNGNGWSLGIDRSSGNVWISEPELLGAAQDQLVQYTAEGEATGEVIDTADIVDVFAADIAYNSRTNMFWQVNVSSSQECIFEINPQSGIVTGNTICPELGTSQRGLAFDPISNTFFSGSWNDGVIHQFDTTGTVLRTINVNLAIAGLAYNPISGHLFVTHNGGEELGIYDIYVLDANTPNLAMIGGFNVNLDSNDDGEDDLELSGQAGLDIDCAGNLWAVDQVANQVISFSGGGEGVCDWNNIPWITTAAGGISIAAESSHTAKLNLDTNSLEIGSTAKAMLSVANDSPYGTVTLPVNLTVTAPNYGELALTETSVEVKNGEAVEFTVSRTNGDDFAVTVDYTLTDGIAVAGEHFTAKSGTLTWDDKDTSDKVITIETLDTDLDIPANFNLVLSNPSQAVIGDNQNAVIILTPDNLGKVSMATSSVTVDEQARNVSIKVNRTDGSDRAISVNYTTVAGTATTADFTFASAKVTWEDGDTATKTISVNITDDKYNEQDLESFNVVLSTDNKHVQMGDNVTLVNIKDNESSGGSIGFLSFLGLILLGLRRRVF